MRILIAEDDPTIRHMMQTLVSRQGISCTLAENGERAVAAWEESEYDAVIMDVQMPVMDGCEASRMIREKELQRGGHTPIIAITAYAMASDREKYLNCGMDDYITKPIDFSAFLTLISKYDSASPNS
jgi:CheY-like chemotaxis protein